MSLARIFGNSFKMTFAVVVTLALILTGFAMITSLTAVGDTVDSFKGDKESYNLNFTSAGVDATPTFTIENDVPVIDASMKISTVNNGDGLYPFNPIVDAGADGDMEWAFNVPGYGDFGRQNKFTTNMSSATSEFNSAGGTDTTADLFMPKDATVTKAEMSLRGRFVPTAINSYDISPVSYKYIMKSNSGNIDNQNGEDIVACSHVSPGKILLVKCPSSATSSPWDVTTLDSSLYQPDAIIGNIADTTGGGDIVAVDRQYTGGVYWFSNDNNDGSKWTKYTIDTGQRYPAYVKLGDMDNDGDLDVVVGCYGYYTYFSSSNPMVMWFENDGTPKTGTWTQHTIFDPNQYYDGYSYGIDVGDFNNDGDLDVAWIGYYYYGYLKWGENPGTKTGYWHARQINTSSNYDRYIYGIVAADFDQDGYDDIATCSSSSGYGTAWWRSNGGASWTKYRISTSYYGYAITAAQMDGANGPDILVPRYAGSGPVYVVKAGATPTSGGWTTTSVSLGMNYPRTISTFNPDGANGLDIFTSAYNDGHMKWYQNTGSAASFTTRTVHTAQLSGMRYPYDVSHGDIDGDNDLDIVVNAYYSYDVVWFENDGTPTTGTWPMHMIDNNARYAYNNEIVDLDDDGDLDVIATHNYYSTPYCKVMWYENNGDGSSWVLHTICSSMRYPTGIDYGDIDKDGHLDVIVSNYYYSQLGVYWFEAPNDPSTGSWIQRTVATGTKYSYNVDVGDIDNDGDLDIAYAAYDYSSGGVSWFECPSNPKTQAWNQYDVVTSTEYCYDLKLADINKDNSLDIVYSSYYDGVRWTKNPATNPKNVAAWTNYQIANDMYSWGLDVADIGQDDYLDVVYTTYYQNKVYWCESPDNPVSGNWVKHTVENGLYYAFQVTVADFDEDGVEDIIATGGGYNDVDINMYKIQTQYCTDPEIDIGNDGVVEWTIAGECKGEYTFDFTSKLNDLLANSDTIEDQYGNIMTMNPVQMTVGSSAGKVTIYDIDIEYDYTATVDVNPHNGDLAAELQEYLDGSNKNKKTFELRVAVGSAQAGEMVLSDLEINYNSHPDFTKDINTISILEDTDNSGVLDLSSFFDDDFDDATTLNYSVVMSKDDRSKVELTIDGTNLNAKTLVENWNGQVNALIIAEDNGDGAGIAKTKTISNTFPIVVMAVNDEPVEADDELPDVEIAEGAEAYSVDLDLGNYFSDVDSTKFYYKAELQGEYTEEDMKVTVDSKNLIKVQAMGDFTGEDIPVRIYCDDDNTFHDEPEDNPYKEFTVDVYNLPDDAPYWDPIEPIYIPEDGAMDEPIDLTAYINDPDTPINEIQYYIAGNTNSSWLPGNIDEAGKLTVTTAIPDYEGSTMITLKATDGYNSGVTVVWVYVVPENDAPWVSISNPLDGDEIPKDFIFTMIGNAKDAEDLQFVEVAIEPKGSQPSYWYSTQGASTWLYTWSTAEYEVGQELTIYARCFDGVGYSELDSINVKIGESLESTKDDWDGDGIKNEDDAFPNNPYEYKDTDGDEWGDFEDPFPEDKNEWQDSDLDGIGDNSDPTPYGDGLIDDPTQSKKKDAEGASFSLWYIVLAMTVILVAVLIWMMVKKTRSRKPVKRNKKVNMKKKAEK